jgi:hypothetical protein
MPRGAPINADLIRVIFSYDPATGELLPKPTAKRVASKSSATQWEVGAYRYSTHRLVWAWHHPESPNPYCVQFNDGDRTNTRIENLSIIHTNPRWVHNVKTQKMRINADGVLVPVGADLPYPTVDTSPPKPRLSVMRRQKEITALSASFEQFLREMDEYQ